jgi:CrcB protein
LEVIIDLVYLLVGMAGSIGAILRYLVGLWLTDVSMVFPFSTLTINLIGSFLLAWLTSEVFVKFSLPSHFQTAIGTGLVGSFTTFSTLSVETVNLFQDHHFLLGVIYLLVSLFGGLLMSRLGFSVRKEVEDR